MSGRRSRNKGARAERQAGAACRALWGCKEAARTTQSASAAGNPDLRLDRNVHCEVKHHKRVAAIRFLEQAEKDARHDSVPFVMMREDGDIEWCILLRAKSLRQLAHELITDHEPEHDDQHPATDHPGHGVELASDGDGQEGRAAD